jgi:LruC domain-containing protein
MWYRFVKLFGKNCDELMLKLRKLIIMKALKRILFVLLAVSLVFTSCKKELKTDEPTNQNENVTFTDIKVPVDFDWSSVAYKGLTINAVDANNELSTAFDGMPLNVTTLDGELIQAGVVNEGQFVLTLNLPKTVENVRLYCAETDQEMIVSVDSQNVNFAFTPSKSFASLKDSDGDHVVDKYDQFPNDATRAFYGGYFSGGNHAGTFKDSPAGDNYYFHIFEDLWPSTGDYDFNDIIIALKFGIVTNWRNEIVGGNVTWYVWSVGSSQSHPTGLGHEFMKFTPNNSTFHYMDQGSLTSFSSDFESIHIDPGTNASNNLILYNNIFDHLDPYYNNCGDGETAGQTWGKPGTPIKIEYSFTINSNQHLHGIALFPYLFMTNEPGKQVRTYGMPPSATADMSLLNTYEDVSPTTWNWDAGNSFVYPLVGSNSFYKTANYHPWGLEFCTDNFKVPLEKVSILEAYPQFQSWAESGGNANPDWYDHPDNSKVFDVLPYFEP